MFKILEKRELAPSIKLFVIEAPIVAKKSKARPIRYAKNKRRRRKNSSHHCRL